MEALPLGIAVGFSDKVDKRGGARALTLHTQGRGIISRSHLLAQGNCSLGDTWRGFRCSLDPKSMRYTMQHLSGAQDCSALQLHF